MSKKYSAEKLFIRTVKQTPRLSKQEERDLGRKINRAKFEIIRLGLKSLDLVLDYSCFADGCGHDNYESEPQLTTDIVSDLSYLDHVIENNTYARNEEAINNALEPYPRSAAVAPELKRAWQEYRELSAQLVNANLYLVEKRARYFSNYGFNFIDLVQDGNLGLVRAVEMYNPERKNQFRTYAKWWILQSMRRKMKDYRTIVFSVQKYDQLNVLRRNIDNIVSEGLTPSLELLVERTGYKRADVELLLANHTPRSLDYEVEGNGELTMHQTISDERAASPEQITTDSQLNGIIRRILANLSPREEKIIRMRFGVGEYTLEEVGEDFDFCGERIRQIEAKALKKLRKPQHLRLLGEFL